MIGVIVAVITLVLNGPESNAWIASRNGRRSHLRLSMDWVVKEHATHRLVTPYSLVFVSDSGLHVKIPSIDEVLTPSKEGPLNFTIQLMRPTEAEHSTLR